MATINSPITPTSLGWSMVSAGLDKVTMNAAKDILDYGPMLFNSASFGNGEVKQITRKVFSGITDAAAWANETNDVIPDAGIEFLYDVQARQFWYANGVQYTLDLKTFDPYQVKAKLAESLGKSGRVKRQKLIASWFNLGFATSGHPWNDVESGVAFFSASHPNDSRIGGVQSNLVTGTQSVSTFSSAIDVIINLRDPLGNPLNLMPKRLFVYPTKAQAAREYLNVGSMLKSGTANNDRNPFKDYNIEVVPYPWFTTTTSWVMQASEHQLYANEAVVIDTKMTDLPNHGTKHDLFFCRAQWGDGWQGYVGGQGV